MHLAAYFASIPTAVGTYPLPGVFDGFLNLQNGEFQVPYKMRVQFAVTFGLHSNVMLLRAQKWRDVGDFACDQQRQGIGGNTSAGLFLYDKSQRSVTPDDSLAALSVRTTGATANVFGHVILGEFKSIKRFGSFCPVRFTTTNTTVIGSWTRSNIAFVDALPQGRYAVIGMRTYSTSIIFARLLFNNQDERPGFQQYAAVTDQKSPLSAPGALGEWGQFNHYAPPEIECMGTTAVRQDVTGTLDLIKVS